MNNKEFQSLKINGQPYDFKALKKLCSTKLKQNKIQAWEKHIYSFIEELLSDKNYVSVQTSGSTGKSKALNYQKNC